MLKHALLWILPIISLQSWASTSQPQWNLLLENIAKVEEGSFFNSQDEVGNNLKSEFLILFQELPDKKAEALIDMIQNAHTTLVLSSQYKLISLISALVEHSKEEISSEMATILLSLGSLTKKTPWLHAHLLANVLDLVGTSNPQLSLKLQEYLDENINRLLESETLNLDSIILFKIIDELAYISAFKDLSWVSLHAWKSLEKIIIDAQAKNCIYAKNQKDLIELLEIILKRSTLSSVQEAAKSLQDSLAQNNVAIETDSPSFPKKSSLSELISACKKTGTICALNDCLAQIGIKSSSEKDTTVEVAAFNSLLDFAYTTPACSLLPGVCEGINAFKQNSEDFTQQAQEILKELYWEA